MNRLDFLTELRYSLEQGGLQKSEIDEALRYYEEIFLDAGKDNEEQTAENLGSPKELAREILIENGIHADGEPEFQMEDVKEPFENHGNTGNTEQNTAQNGYQYNYGGYNGTISAGNSGNAKNNLVKLLVILLTFPIWLPCAAVIFAIAASIFAVGAALVVALAAVGFGLTIGGIVSMFYVPPVGIALLGCGLIAIGLFGLIVCPIAKLIFKGAVGLVNGIIGLIRKIFNIGGVRANG